MYSVSSLTEDEAKLIADAYFRGEKDPARMASVLGTERFDLNLLMHPLVKAKIVERKLEIADVYSHKEHIENLKKIRDACMEAENWKIALTAEVSLGKAAGLYEPKNPFDDLGDKGKDATQLSTEELRRRLTKVGSILGAPAPAEDQVPRLLDDSEEDDNEV